MLSLLARSRPTLSALSTLLLPPILYGNPVSAESASIQTQQGSNLRLLLRGAECHTSFGFGQLWGECAFSFGSPSYLSIWVPLLCLMSFCFLGFKTRSGRRLLRKKFRLVLFIMISFLSASFFLLSALLPGRASAHDGPSASPAPGVAASTSTVHSPEFTVPASADLGMSVLPNIEDPQAVNPQDVCPGYTASAVQKSDTGFTADLHLAGPACNVYGNDVEDLTLLVRFQADDRVHVQIQPRYIGQENETWFLLPEALVPSPSDEQGARESSNNMAVTWSNEPSFSFTVKRKDTGDTLFTSEGKALVFEDQFIEFGSSLPENYNLYGLGEVIHGFRLGNNLTSESSICCVRETVMLSPV